MKLVIDISYYQKPRNIDYDVLLARVDGVILRAGYGTGVDGKWPDQPDPEFDRHYAEIKARGVPVGAYHYIVEYKTVDAQIEIMKRALDGKELELGFWTDVEYERNVIPKLTRRTVIEYMTKIENWLGEVGIYTGAWCWNPIMGTDNPYASRKLWVGSYTLEPRMPNGWDTWWLWQYTSSGRIKGYGGNLDMNRITDENWEAWTGATIPDVIEPLEVPLLSQKDSRWASDKLGTSPVTIGSYGCLITAVAMVCNYYGHDTDPGRINKALIDVNGYANDNLLKFAAVEVIYPDITVDWDNYLSNPEPARIDAVLKQGIPVIVQVDYNTATPALEQHWVLIVGKDDKGYLIADPINGQLVYLSRYADKPYRMVVYKQQAVEPGLFQAKCVTGALNVRKGPSTAYEKVGLLIKGQVVNVYEVLDNWFRIGKDQ
jgi:GH25 family lysozyme M1 (1,4-beta-N-acetylmuramidase)